MDKAEFDQFVDYYIRFDDGIGTDVIDHLYKKFSREFIHNLPVECVTTFLGNPYSMIHGTNWIHSATGPAVINNNQPEFFILGHCVTLDEWLPRSALSPEEQLLYKLKYEPINTRSIY